MSDLERVAKAYMENKNKKKAKFRVENLPDTRELSPKEFEDLVTPNSKKQWLQNRKAGDSSALENSYEDWKKL